jgi:hypothetical protein
MRDPEFYHGSSFCFFFWQLASVFVIEPMLIQEALILLAQLAKVTIKGRFFVSGWDRRSWRSTVSESACGNDKLVGVVDLRCRLGLLR